MRREPNLPANLQSIELPPGVARGQSDRLLVVLGAGLAVLGVAAYVVQMSLQSLMAPWYMPILGFFGLVLIVTSLVWRRTVWRIFGMLAVALLLAAEVAFFLAMRLPPYAGPIAVGQPFPAFATRRADGAAFTQRDFLGDRNSVLVFFRGRW